jgi:hypothetical protein
VSGFSFPFVPCRSDFMLGWLTSFLSSFNFIFVSISRCLCLREQRPTQISMITNTKEFSGVCGSGSISNGESEGDAMDGEVSFLFFSRIDFYHSLSIFFPPSRLSSDWSRQGSFSVTRSSTSSYVRSSIYYQH